VSSLSDSELIARLPALVQAERRAMADVIEHLVEVERRRLYLAQATSSLYRYCIERLGYPEDAALKRHRVARLALRLPQVLGELRSGAIHLTGLFLLSTHLTEANAGALLAESRGKSRRQIEELIARWFPRPDVPPSVEPVAPAAADPAGGEQPSLPGTDAGPAKGGGQSGAQSAVQRRATCSGAGKPGVRGRLEPLSESRCRVEFTARAELRDKLERARELSSHSIPSGDLGELFERALDALIEKESRKRHGAGRPRKPRKLKAGSRHVPVEIARGVWERDGGQCTFVDGKGRRCSERRFLTVEHRQPFALGGPPTLDNLCLLCRAHNLESARNVFGDRHIEEKLRARGKPGGAGRLEREAQQGTGTPGNPKGGRGPDLVESALSALCRLGFRRHDAAQAIERVRASESQLDLERLLRKSLFVLVPAPS